MACGKTENDKIKKVHHQSDRQIKNMFCFRHQNAVVRATSCRLLLRLCSRLGPERVLSLPRESRDAILNTGARSLTEGSLDTR